MTAEVSKFNNLQNPKLQPKTSAFNTSIRNSVHRVTLFKNLLTRCSCRGGKDDDYSDDRCDIEEVTETNSHNSSSSDIPTFNDFFVTSCQDIAAYLKRNRACGQYCKKT